MPTDVSEPKTTRPIQRPRGVPNAASMQLCRLPPCTTAAETRRSHDAGQLLGRRHDRRAQRGRRHDLDRAGESVLGHDLARGGHQQDEPGRRLGDETSAAAPRPRARARASGEATDRVEHLDPGEPQVGVRLRPAPPAPGRPRPGAASTDPVLPRRWTKVGLRIPRPLVARPSRWTRLAASAAMARPSMPSISRSATTSPSVPEISSDPRTPGTWVTRSSAASARHACCSSQSRASRAARSAISPSRAIGSDGSRTVSSRVSGVGATRNRFPSGDSTAIACQAPEAQQLAGPGGLLGHAGQLGRHSVADVLVARAAQAAVEPESLAIHQHHP